MFTTKFNGTDFTAIEQGIINGKVCRQKDIAQPPQVACTLYVHTYTYLLILSLAFVMKM